MRRKQHPADQHARKLARRERKRIERASLVMLALAACGGAGAARAEEPASLDDQLRSQLGLGEATGCFTLLGTPQGDQQAVANALALLTPDEFGNELRAICGPSAVSSASSLGGGLSDFQATKTVSQFRLARRRIDARLRRGGRRTDWEGVQLAYAAANSDMASLGTPGSVPAEAWSLFGELEGESREREDTRFEDGYEADSYSATIGVDYSWSDFVAGGWVSYSDMDGDFTAGSALISPAPAAATILSDPATLAAICGGGATSGGDFSNSALSLGAFWGMRFGETAFVDATASYANREYDYTRNLCSIELPSTTDITYVGGVLAANGITVDDIYAGAISGAPDITEYGVSVRSGFDLDMGGWIIGPRAALSYTRTEIDAYAETGRSTVANTVEPNIGPDIIRTLGGPTGFELAYEDQDRSSLLLEIGAEFSRPIEMSWGVLAPHGSVTLRHEFEDDRELVTVRMAQDNRGANATRFAFATDAPDADDIVLSAGLTALVGMKMAADLEVTHLAANELYESTAVSAQFRVRF